MNTVIGLADLEGLAFVVDLAVDGDSALVVGADLWGCAVAIGSALAGGTD